MTIELTINGEKHSIPSKSNRTLLDVLREDLGLKGAKKGCGEGKCGSCTVLMDGLPVNSCLILAPEAGGAEITTIEGLSAGKPHPLQSAFSEKGAVQCGFCTPGMILTSKALLDLEPGAHGTMIREAISGNLCRCTGYIKIVEAVESCASQAEK